MQNETPPPAAFVKCPRFREFVCLSLSVCLFVDL